jgi:hypothetical protein
MKKAAVIGLVAGLVLFCQSATAYEQDTHYGLTYYLARQAGFTPANARRIASFAWNIDIQDSTKPAPDPLGVLEYVPFVGAAHVAIPAVFRGRVQIGSLNIPWPAPTQSRILMSFHGFPLKMPMRQDKNDPTKSVVDDTCTSDDDMASVNKVLTQEQVIDRLEDLWKRGMAAYNPGVYVHYFQDVYAHTGYPCAFQGHAANLHTPDFLSTKPNVSQAMALAVFNDLAEFMNVQQVGDSCPLNKPQIKEMVDRLIEANTVDFVSRSKTPAPVIGALLGWPGSKVMWDNAKPFLDRGLPEGEGVPEFTPFDWQEVKQDDSSGYLNVGPMYTYWRVADQHGRVVLAEEKWQTQEPTPRKAHFKYVYNANSDEPLDLEIDGAKSSDPAHAWTFESYDPKTLKWTFSRKPLLDELLKEIPAEFKALTQAEWDNARNDALKKSLMLHIELQWNKSACQLSGNYYRGAWNLKKDFATGKIEVSVPEGRNGWGKSTPITFVRAFRSVPR